MRWLQHYGFRPLDMPTLFGAEHRLMPTLLIWRGHKFRFYSLDRNEPPHVHVLKDGRSLKVWLQNLEVARNRGYTDREVARLSEVVGENRLLWMSAWNDFFGF